MGRRAGPQAGRQAFRQGGVGLGDIARLALDRIAQNDRLVAQPMGDRGGGGE
jgi:hypothetical protein